jgi:hypothetical protein
MAAADMQPASEYRVCVAVAPETPTDMTMSSLCLVIESRARRACSQAREASNSLGAAGLPVLVVPVP